MFSGCFGAEVQLASFVWPNPAILLHIVLLYFQTSLIQVKRQLGQKKAQIKIAVNPNGTALPAITRALFILFERAHKREIAMVQKLTTLNILIIV